MNLLLPTFFFSSWSQNIGPKLTKISKVSVDSYPGKRKKKRKTQQSVI